MRKLDDGRIYDEAKRIAGEFQKLTEPNSPEKSHFIVKLSQDFCTSATSRDCERLFDFLPYKSFATGGIMGKQGIYAMLPKEENRDVSMPETKKSIRDQLKAEKKVPVKPAKQKSKSNEMEV